MTENGDYVILIKKNASILDSLCRDHYVMICPAVSILHWHFEGLERVATLIMHLSQLNKKFTIKFSFRNFISSISSHKFMNAIRGVFRVRSLELDAFISFTKTIPQATHT